MHLMSNESKKNKVENEKEQKKTLKNDHYSLTNMMIM
jgi:hypothetical protein